MSRPAADPSADRRRSPLRAIGAVVATAAAVVALAGCGAARSAQSAAESAAAAISRAAASASAADTEDTAAPDDGSDSPSADPTTSAAAFDVCALLPAATATELNHVAYDTTETVSNGDFHGCQYHNTGADQGNISDLSITTTTTPGCWAAAQSDTTGAKSVPGVGDEAFGYQNGMDVRIGGRCLTIEGETLAESDDDYSADIAMATLLLPQLPGA